MKKIFKLSSLFLTLGTLSPVSISLLATSCSANCNIKELSVYDAAGEIQYKTKILYKTNSCIPYINLKEFFSLLQNVHKDYVHDPLFNVDISRDGSNYIVKRKENNAILTINPSTKTLIFSDWALFNCEGTSRPTCAVRDYGEYKDYTSNEVRYLAWGKTEYRIKEQNEYVIYLEPYDIDMYEYNNELYIPFQTMSDIFLTDVFRPMTVLKNIIISPFDYQFDKDKENTYLPYILDNVLTFNQELLDFNYKETCFFLDMDYGLMEEKKYTSFNDILESNGWKDKMLKSLKDYEDAMDDFVANVLDDGHSRVLNWVPGSARTGIYTRKEGPSGSYLTVTKARYIALRKSILGDNIKKYDDTTVSDTAIITFDDFIPNDDADFYATGAIPDDPNDATSTEQLFFSAYKKIANDTNIKNIVVDLTCNGGGDARTCFIIAGMLAGGEFMNVFKNTVEGSICGQTYFTDSNLDHKIDENDFKFKDKNVYILTSNYSFSCANMLPTMLFNQPNCHIVGQRSGGGSCCCLAASNALGQGYRISGTMKLGYLKNGIFYNNDSGIEPSLYIEDSKFYDRTALLNYIKAHQ